MRSRQGLVVLPRPPAEVRQPRVRDEVGVDVDDVAGQVVEDLAATRVVTVHARDRPQPTLAEVLQQRVHRRRPGPGRPADRVADPHRAADVAALQRLAVEQPVLQRGDERPVRLEPVDLVEVLRGQPAQLVVVVTGPRLGVDEPAHRDPEQMGRPDRLVTVEPAVDHDRAAELLADLADQRVARRLPRLDLAARELPPAGDGGWRRTPGGEEAPVPHDRGADDERRASLTEPSGRGRGGRARRPSPSSRDTARVPRSSSGYADLPHVERQPRRRQALRGVLLTPGVGVLLGRDDGGRRSRCGRRRCRSTRPGHVARARAG